MKDLEYGVIGNCKSAALVSESGSIDWLCLPNFDSASVFARILDEEKGGMFDILVDEDYSISQTYVPKTNLLKTRFSNGKDAFVVFDFMPRYTNGNGNYYSPPDIIRYIKWIKGEPTMRVRFQPRLNYAASETELVIRDEYIKGFSKNGPYDSVYLYSSFDKNKVLRSEELTISHDHFFLMSYNQKLLKQDTERAYLKMERTKVYWLNWSERTRSYKRYNNEISRSALVLKLLSFDKSGAILAALTTSIPETIGEVRNWDYRFCWIRDASMVIRVLTDLGHLRVAKRFLNFIIDIIPEKDEKIQIMYGINGDKKLTERTLDHLSGYKNSKPVRIGNEAYKQKQHDIYGVLMDVIYQHFKLYETSLENSEEFWTIARSIVRSVEHNWKRPDRGIWEIRNEQKHFTFSKVLCWVAIDRGVKIASLLNRSNYVEEWTELRKNIKEDILKKAWDEDLQAFTQAYGSTDLDASNLLMESYGFIDAMDPRFISTVKAIRKHLEYKGLMYRYKNRDDFGLPSSSFTICTFWLINALYKIGERDEAREKFEELLGYSNSHGLFSEDIDFNSKGLLGNFPQAYSHLALIETAILISKGELSMEEQMLDALH
ncbi:MAG: glycoside hydrolase family 15 protein [Bacteroidota bacterium]